jgi:hypothetical protein
MKKAFLLAAALATFGSVGCTTTSPDKKYAADAPPPIQKNSRPAADDTPKLPPSQVRVNPEDIDETNYKDMTRKLESDLKSDGRALSQAK